ncbi:MAG: DUF3501 family protein [Acidimicrobiia bacterium]|nr:DUF3501 family protein [Acidimicrobiia bacterium]
MATATSPRQLTIADIADMREYERVRDQFRAEIIALKAKRRIGVGPVITLLFENRDTIRFQIQEMARVEKLLTDEAIQAELDVYNPLIPEPGHLEATLFLELTSNEQLLEWLPKLVGIERAVRIRIGDGDTVDEVSSIPERAHAAQLTREETTASVHYIGFSFTPAQIERMATEPVALAIDHDHYIESTPLSADTVAELLSDLRG